MFSQFTALVVEGNPLARSVLVRMLGELGFKSVSQASKPKEALPKLEAQIFDFIFCEYHFADSTYTGQAFVDDLRANKLLPMSTAFVMVSSEASRSRVSEAAESALDSYLLKPFYFNDLKSRMQEVRARKEAFKYVYAELALNDYEGAASLCEEMVGSRSRYWVHAARIAAELRLREGEFEKATELFNAVAATAAVPWAKLGLARVDLDGGRVSKASRALESLVVECPTYADTYDVMGRALVAQGDLAGATAVYQKAVTRTPSSITRLQKLGALAFFQDDRQQAEFALDKAFRIGAGSKMYDYQSLVLLAFLRFDSKTDPKFTQSAWSLMRKQLAYSPGSFRLETMLEVLAILAALQSRQLSHAIDGITSLAAKITMPLFDFEMACNFLSVLKRLNNTEVHLSNEGTWTAQIAARFCTTRVSVDILTKSIGGDTSCAEELEQAFSSVSQMAQSALAMERPGSIEAVVQELLTQGKSSFNARILEVAGLVAERYRENLPAYEVLLLEINELREGYCSFGTQVGLSTMKPRRKLSQTVVQFA